MTDLVWKPARAKGSILADVGDNLGRYVIEHCKSGRFELRLHGQPVGMFDTARAQSSEHKLAPTQRVRWPPKTRADVGADELLKGKVGPTGVHASTHIQGRHRPSGRSARLLRPLREPQGSGRRPALRQAQDRGGGPQRQDVGSRCLPSTLRPASAGADRSQKAILRARIGSH
jgi:hypothetical protein